MSKFNQQKVNPTKTINYEGTAAYSQNPELELANLLITSFAQDQYYRKTEQTFDRLKELLQLVNPEFAAKAAVYARNTFGMRSITHVLAAELAKYVSGKSYAVSFYNTIIHRADDMSEIAAYYFANCANGKTLTNAMKKGFAKALTRIDSYGLAKYRGTGKGVKLVDIMNMVHVKPNDMLKELYAGTLKSTDTWEMQLSAAGQSENSDEMKKEVWVKLIREKKIKYFALLRNLRNIVEQAPEILYEAISLLTDEKLIRKSLVLPFRFVTAIDELNKINTPYARLAMTGCSRAMDISLSNVPEFEGSTCVILDESQSMTQAKCSTSTVAQVGALFAAVLCKGLNADLITFAASARYRNVSIIDSTYSIAKGISFAGGGTNFSSAIAALRHPYDRLIIISDMQGWMTSYSRSDNVESLKRTVAEYKKQYNVDPLIYSFDLAGYGTMQFPEQRVLCLAGFSDKTLEIMALLEKDRNALINEIKKIEL